MKVLITGHKGFIGSTLMNTLRLNSTLELFGLEKDEPVQKESYDIVIHCGAIARTAECNDIFSPHGYNVQTTLDLLQHTRFEKFVYISSCAVYGSHDDTITEESTLHLPSIYSSQKLYSEQLVTFFGKTRGIPTCGLRLFNVYGIGQSQAGKYPNVIASMLRTVKTQNKVQVTGDGTQIRDFVHVNDVVNAITAVSFSSQPENNPVYNVCTNVGYDMNYIANTINNIFIGSTTEYIAEREFDMYKQIGSYQRIYNDTGWKPTQQFPVELEKLVRYEYESL